MKNTNNRRSGFTLIELLISLAIIALMSGLAFAALNSARLTANDTRRVGDLKNVQGYLEIYYNRCGHYPGGAVCFVTPPASWAELSWAELGTSLTGIIDESRFPKDPISNTTYFYSYWTDGFNYVLGATLQQPNSQSLLKESYDGNEFSSDCDKADRKYCIRS